MNNNNNTLGKKTISGMIWSFTERFGVLIIQFISNLVLARILIPDDFGLIGMMLVFINISSIFIDGGFGAALIQKKNPTKEDYSTVFFINLSISLLCYTLLFIFSNSIATFFHQPQLSDLLRVLGLILVIESFNMIQLNILMKRLDFNRIAKIRITAILIGNSTGIVLALTGFGVWSLVAQSILNSLFTALLLWKGKIWTPSFVFSKISFNSLFSFGSKILLGSLLSALYKNFQTLIIGRRFSSSDLGYFTQAQQLEGVPTGTLMYIVNSVTLPVFSQMQDSLDVLRTNFRKTLKSLTFINFPLMTLLAVIATPLFSFLYTDKWLPAVPYFQLLCLGFGTLLLVHSTNLNLLKALGRSDTVLYLEIAKKVLGISLIFYCLRWGIMGLLIALTINSVIEFFLNGFFTSRYLKYSIKDQLRDILPMLLVSLSLGFIIYYLFKSSNLPAFLLIILQSLIFMTLYILFAFILRFDALKYYSDIFITFYRERLSDKLQFLTKFLRYLAYLFERYLKNRFFSSSKLNYNLKIKKCLNEKETLFGYYNLSPENRLGKIIACSFSSDHLNIILSEGDRNSTISSTRAFNVQQGCMLQWDPIDDNSIYFNDFDYDKKNYFATKININTKDILNRLSRPICAIASTGDYILSLNFERLAVMRPDYGYFCKEISELPNYNSDGIWKIDPKTDETELIISLQQLIDLAPSPTMEGARHKVNHIDISPNGERFMFLHRWIGEKGRFMRLITSDKNGKNLYILNDGLTSHCCWFNNTKIISFCETKRYGTSYTLFTDQSPEYNLLSSKLPTEDGHPSVSPDGKWMITDTYPDRSRMSRLILYSIETDEIFILGRFFQPFRYKNTNRIDLHPKWNKKFNHIYFESGHNGKRNLYSIDISQLIN